MDWIINDLKDSTVYSMKVWGKGVVLNVGLEEGGEWTIKGGRSAIKFHLSLIRELAHYKQSELAEPQSSTPANQLN
jgi:hypothetical protein